MMGLEAHTSSGGGYTEKEGEAAMPPLFSLHFTVNCKLITSTSFSHNKLI
jgi:hypothetical protein